METIQHVNKAKFSRRASFKERMTAGIIFLGLFCFFGIFGLAVHYNVEMGRWLGYCGFKQNFGLPCPTCGMTTMMLAFAQGKIWEAFYIQPAGALIACVLVAIGLLALFVAVSGMYFRFIERFFKEVKLRYIILALLIIVAAGWAVTLSRAIAERN